MTSISSALFKFSKPQQMAGSILLLYLWLLEVTNLPRSRTWLFWFFDKLENGEYRQPFLHVHEKSEGFLVTKKKDETMKVEQDQYDNQPTDSAVKQLVLFTYWAGGGRGESGHNDRQRVTRGHQGTPGDPTGADTTSLQHNKFSSLSFSSGFYLSAYRQAAVEHILLLTLSAGELGGLCCKSSDCLFLLVWGLHGSDQSRQQRRALCPRPTLTYYMQMPR